MKYCIAIIGHKGSGKSTAKDIIMCSEHINKSEYDVYSFPMADTLKRMVSILLEDIVGDDYMQYIYGNKKEAEIPEIGVTPRKILQTLGTDWGRNMIHDDIWTIIQRKRIENIEGNAIIIVDDVRFQNELDALENACDEVVLLEIVRKDCNSDGHVSEAVNVFPSKSMKYYQIDNSFSVSLFKEKIEYVLGDVID